MKDPELFNPFGTNLMKHEVPTSVFDALTVEVETLKSHLANQDFLKEYSMSNYLAGHNSYQIKVPQSFLTANDIESYLLSIGEFYCRSHDVEKHLKLGSVWINYAYKGDFNPIHNHDALLSGVIYIAQDAKIYEEMDKVTNFRQMTAVPGATHFVYKLDHNPFDKTFFTNRSEPGHLLMFPSWLSHFVNPFNSESERITVAFNILENN